jgi:flagellar motility protein MotE (MotC chaperone)
VARTRADEIKIIQQKLRQRLKEVDKLREELAATEARAREETEERTRYPAGDAEILAP